MRKKRILVVIPARGGSKGLPRKNVRPLAGKPLLAYAIEACLAAETVERVIVSTEDAEIATIAKRYGAEVVQRPWEISGDEARSEDAVLHVLRVLQNSEGYVPDITLLVQCTSPLTLPEDIDGTVNVLLTEKADCALAVTPFHGFLWQPDHKLGAIGINHDRNVRLRRQELPPQFIETGAVYAMRTEGFLRAKHRFFGKIALYVMPTERWLEIDEPHDLIIAEILIRKRQREARIRLLPWPIEALVLDFDGVLTNNCVVISEDGKEAVICNRSDGWGFKRLKKLDIPILVISSEENPVVKARCEKLGVPYIMASKNKSKDLENWARAHRINLASVIYVGNDVNDLPCFDIVGCSVAPADAHPDVCAAAKILLDSQGGQGAVRELADMILQRAKEEEGGKSCKDR